MHGETMNVTYYYLWINRCSRNF